MKLHMDLYIRDKLAASSIILTSFRQGVILSTPPQNEPLKRPPRLGLSIKLKISFFHTET